jgi:hypothetical protein
MTKQDTDSIVALINERAAFWVSKGFVGADVYDQLAADPALPESFKPPVVAVILDLEVQSLAKRRKRVQGPSFRRTGPNSVDYPRRSIFHHLRDCFVERRQSPASAGYTAAA